MGWALWVNEMAWVFGAYLRYVLRFWWNQRGWSGCGCAALVAESRIVEILLSEANV